MTKIQNLIDGYRQTEKLLLEQDTPEAHELRICKFRDKFTQWFNNYFRGYCTFEDFVEFMAFKGWDVSFNSIFSIADTFDDIVVFTPLNIHKVSEKTSKIITIDEKDGTLWITGKGYLSLDSNKDNPVFVLSYIDDAIGLP